MIDQQISFQDPNRPVYIKTAHLYKKGKISELHFHKELEFIYVTKGKFKCSSQTSQVIANEGEIIFVNSKIPHYTECIEDDSMITLIQFRSPSLFKGSLKHLSEFFNHTDVPIFVFKEQDPDYDELLKYIVDIIGHNERREVTYDYYITANIYCISAILYKRNFLANEEKISNIKAIKKITPVFDYIDNNYSEQLTLEEIAGILNFNKSYFCRLFKKATGITVMDYINFVRIQNAEELLKTEMNISEISYAVGFLSVSYFNRIFKKHKCCSPTAYRKTISNNVDSLIKS